MSKIIKFAGAAGVALALSGTAMAQPPYERADVVPASVFSWTGFYSGVSAGYGEGSDNVKFASDPVYFGGAAAVGVVPTQLSANNRGLLGGAQIGYNWQFGPLGVVGVEADFSWARINGANSFTDAIIGLFNTTVERKLSSLGTVRARLGFLGTPNLLVYGTAGLALGETGLNVAVTNLASCALGPGCLSSSNSGIKAGWTVGGGYELAIGHGISWKTEYLYADLGSRSATLTSPIGPPGNFYTGSTDFHEHIIRTGVNFNFGAREELVPVK
jgi:outer membrane immunogenic protein